MENVFIDLIKSSGCEYNDSQNSFVFNVEPSLFRRQLTLKLRSHESYPDNISTFFDALQEYTNDIASFRQCLLSAALSNDVPRNNKSSSVDSLLKTLLAIDILQPTIITNLLERLPEFYDELEHNQSSSCTARLILHQLRWLEYIVEPQQLTNTLIEIIQITPNVIQHEIITSLPDILNDTEQKPIVVFLKEWMQQHADLAVPILDALSNLSLHSEYLEDVRETVLERLQSAEIDDLPVIIKFLLQTVTTHTIDMTILNIRQKLDLRALGKVQQSITSSSQRAEQSGPSPEALILDAIKLGLQFHKFVCDAWVKAILALETQRAHKVIDVLVIFILYSMTSMKKKVELIFRKKIQSGLISPTLLKETLLCHANGLSGYWGPILSLSENLLRVSQQQSVLATSAKSLYTHSFKVCDTYNRQELIGALVTHIGSGSPIEMDGALDVLLDLVQNDVSSVAVYNVFIKGVLDYLDNLTLPQTRKLFDIFSILALKGNDRNTNDSSLWSDIQIVLRKQLSNPRVKYKIIGIIGTLSAVKVLGDREMCNDGAGSSSQNMVSTDAISRHPLLQQAVNLLEMTQRSCAVYPTCICMINDELAIMLETTKLDERLCTWITENMTGDFIDDYVIDGDTYDDLDKQLAMDTSSGLKNKLVLDCNGESASIYLKFFSLLHGTNDKRRRKQIVPLCSIFNLLQSCEKINEGSLDGVDALLGCGIMLFDLDEVEDLLPNWQSDEAEEACQMVFMAIDWFREMLNCFSFVADDEEIHRKLIQRLNDILQLEMVMEKLLPKVPTFTPLHLLSTLAQYAEGKDKRIASSQIIQTNTQRTDDSDAEKTIKTNSRFDTLKSLRPYLRPLKIQVLAVLKAPDQDTDSKFTYKDCNYILQDIYSKLESRLTLPVTSVGKKKTTTKKDDKSESIGDEPLSRLSNRQLMEEMIKYIPKILQTFEAVNEVMQSDSTQYDRDESKDCVACSSLIVSILYKLFGWPDIDNPDNQDILMGLINALSERMTDDVSQHSTINKFKGAMRYLTGFHENIPEIQTSVTLFKLQERIMVLCGNTDVLQNDAYRAASGILSQDWIDWREAKKDIPFLLERVIELNENPLGLLVKYVNDVLPAFERGEALESYPLLKADTVVSFYQAILNQTTKCVDLLEKTDQDVDVVLVQTSQVVNVFEKITNYVKKREQRTLFGVLLKASRNFIDQFTKHSIPFFSRVFKDHKDVIVRIFRQLQVATRLLQTICSHVKVIKDTRLSVYVPPLKKSLELVIFQVKMLLTENNAPTDVFYLGSLKHRDISGAQVSSQLPKDVSSDSEADLSAGDSPSPVPQSSKSKPRLKASISKPKATSKPKPTPKSKSKAPIPVYRTSSQVPSSSDEDDNDDRTNRMDIDSDDSMQSDNDDDDDGSSKKSPAKSTTKKKTKSSTGVMPLNYKAYTNFLDQSTQSQPTRDPLMVFSSDDNADDLDSSGNEQEDGHDSSDDDNGSTTPTPTRTPTLSKSKTHASGSSSAASAIPPKPTERAPFDLHSRTNNTKGTKRGYGLGMTRKRMKF